MSISTCNRFVLYVSTTWVPKWEPVLWWSDKTSDLIWNDHFKNAMLSQCIFFNVRLLYLRQRKYKTLFQQIKACSLYYPCKLKKWSDKLCCNICLIASCCILIFEVVEAKGDWNSHYYYIFLFSSDCSLIVLCGNILSI